jgi:post-segregation antitoxin (ccd killing protein)
MTTPAKQLPRFIAVIHVKDDQQALQQARIAQLNGAGGIMLIDHGRSYKRLTETYMDVRHHMPDAWIGVNFLDLMFRNSVAKMPAGCDALWTDYADDDPETAEAIKAAGAGTEWRHLVGTAFKHQPTKMTVEEETRTRARLYDIVCTSGAATGIPPEIEKLALMRHILGNRTLALASGVDAGNVREFGRFVDCFMVATGISQDFHRLDAFKVRELANIIESMPLPLHTMLVEKP